jgi:hypothetical protein
MELEGGAGRVHFFLPRKRVGFSASGLPEMPIRCVRRQLEVDCLYSPGFRELAFSETGLPEMPILGNLEAAGRRRGPRSNDLGPLLYTQALVDWLLT